MTAYRYVQQGRFTNKSIHHKININFCRDSCCFCFWGRGLRARRWIVFGCWILCFWSCSSVRKIVVWPLIRRPSSRFHQFWMRSRKILICCFTSSTFRPLPGGLAGWNNKKGTFRHHPGGFLSKWSWHFGEHFLSPQISIRLSFRRNPYSIKKTVLGDIIDEKYSRTISIVTFYYRFKALLTGSIPDGQFYVEGIIYFY